MRKNKTINWILLLVIPLFILASCGSGLSESTTGSDAVEDTVSTRIDITTNGEGSFTLRMRLQKKQFWKCPVVNKSNSNY